MAVLGEAWIEVHADTGPFDRELQAAIDAALIKAEAAMRARGRDAGNAFSDGVERAVEDRVDGIGSTLGDGLIKEAEKAGAGIRAALSDALDGVGDGNFDLNFPDLTPNLDRQRGPIANWFRAMGEVGAAAFQATFGRIGSIIGDVVQSATRNFATILQGLVGPALIAGIGGLIGIVTGLMPILMPIVALIGSIPFLIGGIGAAAWVLVGIFNEVETAMGKAFEARTPKEVAKAIEGLPPVVGRFVASLSILGSELEKIAKSTTVSFFGELTETFEDLQKSGLFTVLSKGANNLARAMGDLLNELLKFAQTKAFRDFVDVTLNTFAEIIRDNSDGIVAFFSSIASVTKAAAPFMEKFFAGLNQALIRFDNWLKDNPEGLEAFFGDSLEIIKQLMPSLSALVQMVLALIKAGNTPVGESGKTFLEMLGEWLQKLADYLSSEEGQAALQDLIKIGTGLVIVFVSLTAGILMATHAIDDFVESVKGAAEDVGQFFRFLSTVVIGIFAGIYQGIMDVLGRIGVSIANWWTGLTSSATTFGNRIYTSVSGSFNRMKESIRTSLSGAWTLLMGLKDKAKNFFSNSGDWLYNAGRNIVTGLINGIKNAVPGLRSTLSWLTDMIPDLKGPEEKDRKLLIPAGKALMEGLGAGIATGARGVLGDLANLTGMIGANAYANTFNFGPGAIQQNFAGQPTPEMGRSMGNAAGGAIANTVNQQSMRAATRAI